MRVKIASRASSLARLQTALVERALGAAHPQLEIECVTRTSAGDQDQTSPLWKLPDKGAFTAHLYESDEGFERFTRDERWEPVPFGDGHTAIIAGFRLQYRSRCKLTAVCHRVVATERTARHGRYSIVLFFDCVNTPYYNKQKLGPMQQYPAGFNYGIPFPALATYFTEQT